MFVLDQGTAIYAGVLINISSAPQSLKINHFIPYTVIDLLSFSLVMCEPCEVSRYGVSTSGDDMIMGVNIT